MKKNKKTKIEKYERKKERLGFLLIIPQLLFLFYDISQPSFQPYSWRARIFWIGCAYMGYTLLFLFSPEFYDFFRKKVWLGRKIYPLFILSAPVVCVILIVYFLSPGKMGYVLSIELIGQGLSLGLFAIVQYRTLQIEALSKQ